MYVSTPCLQKCHRKASINPSSRQSTTRALVNTLKVLAVGNYEFERCRKCKLTSDPRTKEPHYFPPAAVHTARRRRTRFQCQVNDRRACWRRAKDTSISRRQRKAVCSTDADMNLSKVLKASSHRPFHFEPDFRSFSPNCDLTHAEIDTANATISIERRPWRHRRCVAFSARRVGTVRAAGGAIQ